MLLAGHRSFSNALGNGEYWYCCIMQFHHLMPLNPRQREHLTHQNSGNKTDFISTILVSTSSHCTKIKPNFLGFRRHHLALVIVEQSRCVEVLPIHALSCPSLICYHGAGWGCDLYCSQPHGGDHGHIHKSNGISVCLYEVISAGE